MKALFIFALVSLTGFQIFAQKDQSDLYLTKSLSADNIHFIKAATPGGGIRVEGVSPSDARLEVYVRSNNGKTLTKEEMDSRMHSDYDLSIDVSSGKLTVITTAKSKFFGRNSVSVSYRIYVPKEVSSDLSTSGGGIALVNLKGNQNFKTSGGSLNVDGLSGRIDGRTSGGSIRLSNSSNDINLATSGGSIKAENCEGNIKLTTSGGSLSLTGLKGKINAVTSGGSVQASDISGDLSAKTSGGSIRMTSLACNLETSTSGGSIDVAFVKPVQSIKIQNSAGGVRLALPADQGIDLNLSGSRVNTGKLKNFDGSINKNVVEGKINGGGNSVYVSSASGTVTLDLK